MTVCAGAGFALTAGLLLGAVMRPQLAVDDGPAGLQMSAGRTAGRTDDGLSPARASGQVPAYVTGTDWATDRQEPPPPPADPPAAAAASYYASPVADEAPEPQADAREPAPPADDAQSENIAYPSLDGGAAYDAPSRAETRPRVEPAGQPAEIEPEASPEAAGDTRVRR